MAGRLFNSNVYGYKGPVTVTVKLVISSIIDGHYFSDMCM